jgi:hypothetical protein
MGLYGNTNFQVEFWEPGVSWVTRPYIIPLFDEQPGARVDRGGKVHPESGREGYAVWQQSLRLLSRSIHRHKRWVGGIISSAASMAAVYAGQSAFLKLTYERVAREVGESTEEGR